MEELPLKKRILSSLLALFLVLAFGACGEDISTPEPNAEAGTWAIYWYLCGSDLESNGGFATSDLMEMMEVALPENVRVIIQTGGAKTWQNNVVDADILQRYVYDSEGLTLVDELPPASMGDAATLTDFLRYCKQNYPAEKTAVLFWNHGGGSVSGAAFDERYGYDSLTLDEMHTAFGRVWEADENNPPLELVGFDTCLMATVDVAGTFAGTAHYLVASEETEPANGWYYSQWVQALADDPDGAAQWLTLDEGYRAFAEAQFLELTPEAAGAAQALLGSEMQGKTLPEILQAIRQTLTEHFVYDESVSTQNGTQDFFQYVQSVTARGYSVHYATAAVLMLRYCGVPARYAEGYYLSGQDAASGEQTFELDETHAHAWAEYYLTGVGWVPFEVTPGYVEAEDLGAGGEAGGKQYENTQLPPVVEQPEQQAPQEEAQRSFRWWLPAIPLAAALLALIVCQLWRRRRLHRRIAAMAADEPREAVTQLYGYAVFLLARTGAAPPAGLEQARQDNAEAMFSGHDIPAEKAAAMQRFVQEVLQACRKKRNPLQRFADRWFHIWY